MAISLGMGGAGFNPTAQDAFSTLLSRIPGYMEASQARKRRKAEAELAAAELARRRGEFEFKQERRAAGPQLGSADLGANNMRAMAEGDAYLRSQAMRSAPPTRTLTGFGMTGDVEDTAKYSGLQRQMYLPQNAGLEPGEANRAALRTVKRKTTGRDREGGSWESEEY